MSFRGRAAKVYYASDWSDGSDVPASPTWVEIEKAVDLDIAGTEGDADGSSREDGDVLDVGGLKERDITFGYRIVQKTDAVYTTLVDSYNNFTPLLILVVNDAYNVANTKGWQGIYRVKQLSEAMPLGDAAISNVILKRFPGRDSSGNIIATSRYSAA